MERSSSKVDIEPAGPAHLRTEDVVVPWYDGILQTAFKVLACLWVAFCILYFYMRFAFSLGTYYYGWRLTVLIIEVIGTVSFLLTLLIRMRRPWTKFAYQADGPFNNHYKKSLSENSRGQSEEIISIQHDPLLKKAYPYVVRFLIPCYKESLEIIRPTVLAALNVYYDQSKFFVYLCDDGNDPKKFAWIKKMQLTYPNLGYIRRPKEHKGHGKAGNLNYALRYVLFPDANEAGPEADKYVSDKEILCVLDADMIVIPEILLKLLPYFAEDPLCMAVQTPQSFHNVYPDADYFDAHNLSFFQYTLPATDSWNSVTCCGTNFLMSARYLAYSGWFPTFTVTEDLAIAFRLHDRCGGRFRYHAEHVAFGEAPEDLRQIYQQRSRWAKGNIQLVFKENPIFRKNLGIINKLFFANCGFAYISSCITNPAFLIINAIAVLFGLFPVGNLGPAQAAVFVIYYALFYTLLHFTPVPGRHLQTLWVNLRMTHFFSWMSMKALISVISAEWFGMKELTFKATEKKVVVGTGEEESSRDSSRKDIKFNIIVCIFTLIVLLFGVYLAVGGPSPFFEADDERMGMEKSLVRLMCSLWMIHFFIAYSIPVWYAYVPAEHDIQATVLKWLFRGDIALNLIVISCMIVFFTMKDG